MAIHAAVVVVTALALAGCMTGNDSDTNGQEQRFVLREVAGCSSQERASEIIRDAGAFDDFWARYCRGAPATVDFENEDVAAYFHGPHNSGGLRIEIREAHREDASYAISVAQVSGAGACPTADVFSYPSHVVVLEKLNLPATFKIIKDEVPC